jgi:hypothetical protein
MAGKITSLGHQHAAALEEALEAVAAAPLPGSRDLHEVTGVKPGGFVTSQENTLVEVSTFLSDSRRVFTMSGSIYFETLWKNGDRELVPLTEGGTVVGGAEFQLANLMVCAAAEKGEFSVPRWFADLLLRSEPLRDRLPVITTYARRPVFDKDLVFRNPGWHPSVGVLVHGPAVEPRPWQPPAPGLAAIDRLPPRLKGLLRGFCFKSDADLANFVGFLLTALLVGRYVETGKPIALVNGNQPGVGKTLLARVVGVLADGADPPLLPFTPVEEELRKTIGAYLRAGNGSVIGLDNAKVAAGGKVDSSALESLVSGSELARRILGKSELVRRPNDLVWMLTMNDTKASDDLVRRGLPVCLEYEGDPAGRAFGADPVKYVRQHRVELLGELAGMIDFWTAAGRPEGVEHHRFGEWVREVGGVMLACGFPEFLKNMADAAAEFSAAADELTALAEYVFKQGGAGMVHKPRGKKDEELTALRWVPIFDAAKVLENELDAAKGERSKATTVGQFFARSVGKTVTVTDKEREQRLTLRMRFGRAKKKMYFFEPAGGPAAPPAVKRPSSGTETDLPAVVTVTTANTPGGNDENW